MELESSFKEHKRARERVRLVQKGLFFVVCVWRDGGGGEVLWEISTQN